MITPGKMHDIQAAAKLLADICKGPMVLADKAYDATGCGTMSRIVVTGPTYRQNPCVKARPASHLSFTNNAIWLNNFSTNSNITDALQRDMTSSDQPSPSWSNSLASASG
jgi:hypothetical protein